MAKIKKNKDSLVDIGWREWISLTDFKNFYLKAKIDTGAAMSALHATHIKEYNSNGSRYVKFRFNTVVCNRANLLWRDNNQCQYCGKHFCPDSLTMDHVVPKSRGGKNTWINLVTACKKCNQKKGNKTPTECGMYPKRKPKAPKANILRTINKNQISILWKEYLW